MAGADGAASDAGADQAAVEPQAAASALAAFKAALAEVRTLKGHEDDEEVMQEAKKRLAAAMQAAMLAGVPKAELLEASKGPAAEFPVGDRVEVRGLESESGKKMNGKVGHILEYLADKERFKIELSPDEFVSIKPANLVRRSPLPTKRPGALERAEFKSAVEEVRALRGRQDDAEALQEAKTRLTSAMKAAKQAGIPKEDLMEASGGSDAEAPDGVADEITALFESATPAADRGQFEVGGRVEVRGLESESGMKLNGKVGHIVQYLLEKERFKIQLAPEEFISIKPVNLVRRSPLPGKRAAEAEAGNDGENGSSSSSSSSSEEKRPKKKAKKSGFSDPSGSKQSKKKKSADDALDRLLGVVQENEVLERQKEARAAEAARFAGAAAAEAAAAAAQAAAAQPVVLKPGDRVEVNGLQSETGKKLNGKSGIIKKFIESKGRWEVDLFQATLQSLKAENLKLVRVGGDFAGAQSSGGSSFVNNDYSGPSAGYTLL